jgi:hypothetical protein
LIDFVNELKVLMSDNLQIGNRKHPIKIDCFTCDAPARAFITGIKNHTGYFIVVASALARGSTWFVLYETDITNFIVTFYTIYIDTIPFPHILP